MARIVSISSVKKNFLKKIESNKKLIEVSQSVMSNKGNGLRQKHIEQIRGLAFMSIVASWEEFLEDCMVRYLKGEVKHPANTAISKLGRLNSLDTAYKILGGFKFNSSVDYLKFTNLSDVAKMADTYFTKHPFQFTPEEIDTLKNISIIRNRAAHNSEKCKNSFNKLVVKYLAGGVSGYSVGLFLDGAPNTHIFSSNQLTEFQTNNISKNFYAFIFVLEKLANKIAPV